MRRFFTILILLTLMAGLAIPANAASAATHLRCVGTVNSDGTAQMTTTVTLHLDQSGEDLFFPLPGSATNITVNGSRASGSLQNDVRQVNLRRIVGKAVGDFTLTFTYSLKDLIVTNEAGLLELQLPMLAGYAYPVEVLEFSITLPGPVDAKPAFVSGYHQANIEKDISCKVEGATITGLSRAELKDHETLTMVLSVTEEMFPQKRIVPPDFETSNTLMLICTIAALLYWLLFLRNLPLWPHRRPTPPDGYIAGELHSVLHLQGADLSMMAFSWAQLGYLQIHMDPRGKVTLYKQMDMGNERGKFEQKCFRILFRNRSVVDTAGSYYVTACKQVAKLPANVQSFVHPKSGNIYVFRILACLAGLFWGINLSLWLSADAAMPWLSAFFLSVMCFVSSWFIHRWATALFRPEKRSLWIALGLAGFWLILSAMAGIFADGIWAVLGQLMAGILAAMGGRRTYPGRQAMAEALGLRRYLRHLSRQKADAICLSNPDYFHQLAPYALDLGVDKRFARSFGKRPVNACPYIHTGNSHSLRAEQWGLLMRQVLQSMNARQQRSSIEQITRLIRSFWK